MKKLPAPTCTVTVHERRTQAGRRFFRVRLITSRSVEYRAYREGLTLEAMTADALRSCDLRRAWVQCRLISESPQVRMSQKWPEVEDSPAAMFPWLHG